MTEEEKREWYTNKDLYEMMVNLSKDLEATNGELGKTQVLIHNYNGLREELQANRDEIQVLKGSWDAFIQIIRGEIQNSIQALSGKFETFSIEQGGKFEAFKATIDGKEQGQKETKQGIHVSINTIIAVIVAVIAICTFVKG